MKDLDEELLLVAGNVRRQLLGCAEVMNDWFVDACSPGEDLKPDDVENLYALVLDHRRQLEDVYWDATRAIERVGAPIGAELSTPLDRAVASLRRVAENLERRG